MIVDKYTAFEISDEDGQLLFEVKYYDTEGIIMGPKGNAFHGPFGNFLQPDEAIRFLKTVQKCITDATKEGK